jgi:hypothetical protein
MVLIPSQKWTYFDAHWPLEWVVTAKEAVQDLWKGQYKAAELPVLTTIEQATRPKTGLQKWREQKQQQAPTIDEYIRYCDAACTPIVDSMVVGAKDNLPCTLGYGIRYSVNTGNGG